MKRKLLHIIVLSLAIVILMSALCACSAAGNANGEVVSLSFKQAAGYEYLKKLNGATVSINGYMATSSPADGSFIFLMNMPFQSCPFCVPNTSQLANTMEVYPEKGNTFTYTTQAIRVVGKLVVADNPDKPFTDLYGYQFSFKIMDASYVILKDTDLSEEMQLWQKLSESELINEIYSMYNYVNFVCKWPTYFVNSYTDKEGVMHPGYYLYASDALNYLEKEGGQYHYGYVEGYFEKLVSKIEEISKTDFTELIKNIREVEDLSKRAVADLKNGEYTYEKKYVKEFDAEDYVYTLNHGKELAAEMDQLYSFFSNWLAGWEL